MAGQPKALIYTRISKDSAGLGLGVERQAKECRALARRLDAHVVATLEDNDISGFSRKKRPGFEALQEAVRGGSIDLVIAYAPDRLTRHVRELEDLIDLLESTRTEVQTVQGGSYDLTTPGGRMVARMLGNVARHESEMKSARLRSKMTQKAAAGEVLGGGERPYGYTSNRLHLVPDEAAIIREMVRRVLAGEPMRAIARDLNERGVTTVGGIAWTGTSISRMLKSPRIAGLCEHKGAIVGEAVWPAIIDADTHRRLVALLGDPSRNTVVGARGREAKLLTGFLTCGRCGETMKADARTGGIRAYRCRSGANYRGCGRVSMLAEPLERFVGQAVVKLLDGGALQRAAARLAHHGSDEAAVAELAAVEDRRRELGEMFAADEIGRVEFRAALDALERREAAARASVLSDVHSDVDASRPLALIAAGVSGDSWDDLPVTTQRTVLDVLRIPITIAATARGKRCGDPVTGIDRDRVDIGEALV